LNNIIIIICLSLFNY